MFLPIFTVFLNWVHCHSNITTTTFLQWPLPLNTLKSNGCRKEMEELWFAFNPIYTISANTMVTHFCIDVSWLSSLRTQSYMVSSGVAWCPLREVSCWNRTCCLCPNSRPAHDWTPPLSCWISPVTGVEDESTFEWDWEIDRDFFTKQRLNWEHCTCGRHSHGYDCKYCE